MNIGAEPLVSVIVPCYNVEKYICECMDSIIGQTYQNLEIICIDDGSTDSTGKILDDYSLKDERVVVIHHPNMGVSGARNLGMDCFRGKFVMFVDSDDMIHQKLVATCLPYFTDIVDVVIYPYMKFKNSWGGVQLENELEIIETTVFQQKELFNEIFVGSNDKQLFRMLACNKLYKRELLEGVRFPYGRKYGDDAYVTYHVIKQVKSAVYIKKIPLYFYRDTLGSALNSCLNKRNLELFDTYNDIYENAKREQVEIVPLVTYGYCVRIFDFLSRLDNEIYEATARKELLKSLRKKIKLNCLDVVKCTFVPMGMKIRICLLKYLGIK